MRSFVISLLALITELVVASGSVKWTRLFLGGIHAMGFTTPVFAVSTNEIAQQLAKTNGATVVSGRKLGLIKGTLQGCSADENCFRCSMSAHISIYLPTIPLPYPTFFLVDFLPLSPYDYLYLYRYLNPYSYLHLSCTHDHTHIITLCSKQYSTSALSAGKRKF